jgi:FSR family fosmidomycin resistance protein-like MFS transporter
MKSGEAQTESLNIFQTAGVLTLAVCHFIHDVYSSFLAPLLPLLIEKLSISLAQAGFLGAMMQIPSLLNPFIGKLADRISVRYFIILAPVTTAVPMSLIGLAPGYGVLLILLFITGISVAIFHVPAPVMVARLSGTQVGKGMSFYMTGGELARAIGPMVAVGTVLLLGLEGFYPIMIVGLMASIWLFLKFRDVPIHMNSSQHVPLSRTWHETKHVLLPLTMILIARGFMHASMTTFLPTFIKQETGNFWLAGFGLTALETTGVAGILIAGPLSDHFGRRKILFVSLLGAPISLFVFVAFGGWIRLSALLTTGLFLLSTTPVMLAMVQENTRNGPSAANGIFMMSSFVARSAMVVLVGFIADLIGLRLTYFISASVGLLGIPFILLLPESK